MYDANIDTELNDRTIRLVVTPFFGLVIPNLTGMIDNSQYTWWELWLCYGYFTFIAYTVWQGNRYLLFRLRPRFSWLNQPVQKIFTLIVSNIFYTIPISVGLSVLWYAFARQSVTDWDAIFKVSALCVICVVFITHTYETVFLIRSWETDKLKGEKMERARVEAELEALKNQIDPHFIFNSLNTLSHLIEKDSAKAREFNDNLADVYRYILFNKDRNLVLLREEMEFLEKYVGLIKIRFGNAFNLDLDPGKRHQDEYLIPPISLQILVENAMKHNEFSDSHPLTVHVTVDKDVIIISNEIRPKRQNRPSSRIGLKNLNERYKLVTEKEITIDRTSGKFVVSLPVLKTST
ncbi:MAG: sensor histidine kinase [Ignavibacteriae bacterium]|nr:sensor histidine kinase [Ignavibacteriota bacterium]